MATGPITAALILAGLLYARRWFRLRMSLWRGASFLFGLFLVWLAAASPLAMLDEELLTAHMVQHLLLLTIGPALLLLGFPSRPLTLSPLVCWCAGAGVLVFWHLPVVFAVAFHSMKWHTVEHATFLAAGLLFWQPVIPGKPQWPVVLYLFMATLPCDALSAFLAFSGRLVYPEYLHAARPFFASAVQDQQCAGALMWTVVTMAYMIPAVLATLTLLRGAEAGAIRDRQFYPLPSQPRPEG